MTGFEFLFSLFALLLGFMLVEVLGGFVRAVKAARPRPGSHDVPVRLGWLSPLLGLFLLLDITSYWDNIWVLRDILPLGLDTLFGALFLTSIYYFAASLVFPNDPRDWPDLDAWFWLHRRMVLGCILAVNMLWVAFYTLFGPRPSGVTLTIVIQAAYFAAICTALLARRGSVVGAALLLLSLMYLGFAAWEFAGRLTAR
jgi:hypothetical protein